MNRVYPSVALTPVNWFRVLYDRDSATPK
jgi:hypothetical protein